MSDLYYLIELIEENNCSYSAMGASWDSWSDVEQIIDAYKFNYTKSGAEIQLTDQERLILSRSIATNGKSLKSDLKEYEVTK